MIDIPGWNLSHSGKVRDIYARDEDSDLLLIVASDRISAFDQRLSPPIPGKGASLTALSKFWFDWLLGQIDLPMHPLWYHDPDRAEAVSNSVPEQIRPRTMLGLKLSMLPVECVVRGYLAGSSWMEYSTRKTVGDYALPLGLKEGDRLPMPLFTPTTKGGPGQSDRALSLADLEKLVGSTRARDLQSHSLELYELAHAHCLKLGLILADTKLEFGLLGDQLYLADEVFTGDSSRYWDLEAWSKPQPTSKRLASFDKQPVRDWLRNVWSTDGPPPELSESVISQTQKRYEQLLRRLTR